MRSLLRALGVCVIALVCSFPAWVAAPAEATTLNLHRGSTGPAVKLLETRLHKLHLLGPRAVNRRYTRTTARAVKRFQLRHHLRVTGRVDQRTWNLVARAAAPPRPAKKPAPRPPVTKPTPPPPAPTILGHRGARVPGITENSLAAMEYASYKADILEFDLQLTADDQFVVMHDDALDRTTNCTGPVVAQTAHYLRENCLTDNDDGPIPTFAEIVAFAAGKQKAIAPEVKDNTVTDAELQAFVQVVQGKNMTSRTFVQSFFPAVFPRLRALDDGLTFVYLTGSATPPATVRSSAATIAGLHIPGLTASRVAAYQAAGLRVWAYTASTDAQLKSLWAMRVNGVFTDIPGAARTMYHPS
jgi:glycerophosphoryl diester phosphodiesterase